MHTGKQLGDAIRAAMELKGVKQQAVAEAFGVKQSSVSEWLSFGRLHKKHLTRLVDYFSDVVGPEHWGLPKTWGRHQSSEELLPLAADEIDMISAYRLLDAEDKAEFYAHLGQTVLNKHGPTLRIMERMKLTTRANDASVVKALGGVPKTRPSAVHHDDAALPTAKRVRKVHAK